MTIIVATPHSRHDRLESELTQLGMHVARIRSPQELSLENLQRLSPSHLFFPHWSWKIPAVIFDHFECVIFHITDLPFGRGGSPLQNLITAGHSETMLSAVRCVEDIDAGPIYLKRPLSLHGSAEEILSRAADLTREMISEIVTAKTKPLPQTGQVTYFKRRTLEDGNLMALNELSKLHDYIRMLDGEGYPPAFIDTPHFHFEFTQSSFDSDSIIANVRITRRNHD